MARLTLSLLGPFQATLDGEPAIGFESDKVRALLAYLAVEADQPHSRDKLAGLLWPERPDRDARNNLRYALSNLRHTIGDRAQSKDRETTPPFLHISRQSIQFNQASDAWIDAIAFDRLLKEPKSTIRKLKEAVDLYRGEFLEGFFIADSVPFEEWALLKREQFKRRVLSTLHRLAVIHERRGEYGRALSHAYRQAELEPWQEQAHQQLMRLLAQNGQRGAALAQYEACRHALAEELDVEPAQETTRLYEQIRDGTLDPGKAREAAVGEARVAAPSQAVEALPSPPAPARRPWAGRQRLGRRLAIAAGALLLLAIVAVVTARLFGIGRGVLGTASATPLVPPDGKILHLCEGSAPPQICVYETRTDQDTQVTQGLEFETIGRPSWSPDGEWIVFNAGPRFATASRGNQKLYIIDADGSYMRQITNDDAADVEPDWSADGEWIAFNRSGELWIVRPDGSEAQRLFGQPEKPCVENLAWSPDSQQIVFVGHGCTPVSAPDEIWIVNRDGTDPRTLHAFERQVDQVEVLWSDDGRKILCVHRRKDEEATFLLINTTGVGEPITLDRMPYWWHPTFWPQWGLTDKE
jgi:DNA-binding SARP family transcriptional activator/Tol biopolymer transport system component